MTEPDRRDGRRSDVVRRWFGALGLVRQAAGRWLGVVLGLSVVNGVALAAQLLVGKEILEVLIERDDPTMAALWPWLIALGIVLLIVALSTTAQQRVQELISEMVARQALDRILTVSGEVEFAEFERADFHDDLQRAEVNAIPRVWSTVLGFVGLANQAISMVALVAVVASVMPALLLLAAAAYAPLYWATSRNAGTVHSAIAALAPLDRDLRYHREVLTGRAEAKEVRLFGLAGFLRRRHRALFDQRVDRVRQVVRSTVVRSALALTVSTVLLVASIAILLEQTVAGSITVASAAVGVVGVQQLGARVRGLDGTASSLQEGMLFFDDFGRFLDRAPTIEPAGSPPPSGPHRIEVRDLGFSYPETGRPVLEEVSFSIEQNQVVALVGANGSGKSTLAKLLCGLYEPTNGRISWDGVDIATMAAGQVQMHVSPVFQDFTRYEFSARENIGFGDLEHVDDLDRVREAARRAEVDSVVRDLPAGYETRLSREYADGAELSIGQWQRLAIGRCLMAPRSLVILDEPSAALDAHAEAELFAQVERLAEGRIVLFISHRLASVRRADLLLVLDDGRLVESGTHDDLVATGGTYSRLYRAQARHYVDIDEHVVD